MADWLQHTRRGKRYLREHNPAAAMKSFQKAVDLCPVHHKPELASALFFLGVSFYKLGFYSGSMRSWKVSSGIEKRGYSMKMLTRFVNGYGMKKQSCKSR